MSSTKSSKKNNLKPMNVLNITKKRRGRPRGLGVILKPYTYQLYYTSQKQLPIFSNYPTVNEFRIFKEKIITLCEMCQPYLKINTSGSSNSILKISHPFIVGNSIILTRIPSSSNIKVISRLINKKNLVKKLLNNNYTVAINANTYSSNDEKKLLKHIELKDKYRDLLKTDFTLSTRSIAVKEDYPENSNVAKLLFTIIELILLIYSKSFPKLNILFYQKSLQNAPTFMKRFESKIQKYLLKKHINIHSFITNN